MRLNRNLITTIIILGGTTLLILGVFAIPAVLGIRQLHEDIADDYLQIESKYQLRRHTRSALATMDKLQPRLKNLTKIAIIEGQELEFISALETAASESQITQQLSLETVNQRDVSPWEREIPIRLQAAGTYPQVINYIERVQSLPYYIIFRSMDIIDPKLNNEAGSGQVKADIRGSVRWFAKSHPIFRRIGSGSQSAE